MARVGLSKGFRLVSEGEHTFTVKEVIYDKSFNKVQLKMESEKGEKHTEFFTLENEKALYAFTMTAKILMNNDEIEEIDTDDLVGKSMIATVTHGTSASTGKKYASLTDKRALDLPFEVVDDKPESEEDDFDDLFNDD